MQFASVGSTSIFSDAQLNWLVCKMSFTFVFNVNENVVKTTKVNDVLPSQEALQ